MPRGLASRLAIAGEAREESEQWRRYTFRGRDEEDQSDASDSTGSDSSVNSDSTDSDRSLIVMDSPNRHGFSWDSDDNSDTSSNHSNHSEHSNHSNTDSDNSVAGSVGSDDNDNQSLPDIPDAETGSNLSLAFSFDSNDSFADMQRRTSSQSDTHSDASNGSNIINASSYNSNDSDDSDEDFNRIPGTPSNAGSRSGSNSSRSSADSDDDDDDSGFRPLALALSLPGTPIDRSPRSDRSNGSVTSFIGDFMRSFGQRLDSPLESPPTPGALTTGSRLVMADASRPSTSGTTSSTVSFECSVCLENLDAPASIGDADAGSGHIVNFRGRNGIRPGLMLMAPVGGSVVNGSTTSATDIAATFCGHMYHQMCLEKWFQEQGKRTCPSCRKNVPKSKLIRLYPNISTDSNSKNGTDSAIPSTSGTCASKPPGTSTSAPGPNIGNDGSCGRTECQDMKIIHSTLMNDYADLQTRFDELRENDEVKEAQLQSLMEDNTRKNEEIDRLKRSLEESRVAPSSSSGAKRRRH